MSTVPFRRRTQFDEEKSLPQNLEFERLLLGSILADNQALRIIAEKTKAHDFFLEENRLIYSKMLEMNGAGQPIELPLLVEALRIRGDLAAAGGASYVASLAQSGLPKASNIQHYVEVVKKNSRARQVIYWAINIQARTLEDGCDPDVILQEAESSLLELRSSGGSYQEHRLADINEIMAMDCSPREFVLGPILPVKGLGMIHAWRGTGKSYITMEIAYCIAAGIPKCFRMWDVPKRRRVTYVDAEMDVKTLQERCGEIAKGHGRTYPDEDIRNWLCFITADLEAEERRPIPMIATTEGRSRIGRCVRDGDVLILDNLSGLSPASGNEEKFDWSPIAQWLLSLRRRGITAIFLHHSGKNGKQRGLSDHEDFLNCVLGLREPFDKEEDEGLRCEVHNEKKRNNPQGPGAKPFEVKLEVRDGAAIWASRPLKAITEKHAFELFAARKNDRDVMEILSLQNRHQVYRLRKKYEKTKDSFPAENDEKPGAEDWTEREV